MTTIKINQGAGEKPRELVEKLIGEQKFPFMATITHKSFKPLVVPSTGICDVIAPNVAVPFKVTSFEQLWTVVTDGSALAKRYKRNDEDFVVIQSPVVDAAEIPATQAAEVQAPEPVVAAETTKTSKASAKAAAAASE